MRKKIEWKWDILDDHAARIKVIGGWLVHHFSFNEKKTHFSESMQFIEDKDHLWEILKPVEKTEQSKKVEASDFESPK